jgi:hypothetical protein
MRILGLDRVGAPPGRIILTAVTGRWLRGPVGWYCRAARRRSSSRWRAISCSRYGCIDVGLSPGDSWGPVSPPSRRADGSVTAWLFFGRRDYRYGRAPWPGPHRGPAGRAEGPHARGARAGPCAGRYGSAALFLISPVGHPFRGPMAAARPCWPGSLGNGTDSRMGGASPEGACRVEYRGAAIGHPKVLPGRLGDAIRGSGPAAGSARRPRCVRRHRAWRGRGSRALFDRVERYDQVAGDALVGPAGGEQPQHLQLASGQRFAQARRRGHGSPRQRQGACRAAGAQECGSLPRREVLQQHQHRQ